jgi:uncharacterized membrane protein YfcA
MLATLTTTELLLGAAVIGAAYVIRGIAGFGSGLIAIPLLALMLPLSVAVPLVVFLDYLASASHGVSGRESIQWRELLPLLPFSLLGILIALYLFRSVDPALLTKALGAFIILFAGHSLFSRTAERRISRYWVVPSGSFGGMIGTLFGTGGPFYVLYLKRRGLAKANFRATFATVFLLDGAGRLTGYLGAGYYNIDTLKLIGVAIPVMGIGLLIGGRIHTSMSQTTFQRSLAVLLIVSGTSLLLK